MTHKSSVMLKIPATIWFQCTGSQPLLHACNEWGLKAEMVCPSSLDKGNEIMSVARHLLSTTLKKDFV